jgi:hypothetical protein
MLLALALAADVINPSDGSGSTPLLVAASKTMSLR